MVAYFDPNEEGGTETVALLPAGEAGSEPQPAGRQHSVGQWCRGGCLGFLVSGVPGVPGFPPPLLPRH